MSELITSRLILSPLSEADWSCFKALRSDPEVMRFMGESLSEDALRQKFISRLGGNVFMIRDQQGEAIGDVGLQISAVNPQEADIGYALLPQAQGKGFAQEAVSAVCEYGFRSLGLTAINAWVLAENSGSIRLLERLGFVREQILEKAFEINGVWHDDWVYRLKK